MTLAPFAPMQARDEVQSAFLGRLEPAHLTPQGRIGHAFLLDIDHRPLALEEIFAATEAFDLHDAASPHRGLIVDVLEATPTRTRLHVQPEHAMTYCAVAQEVGDMLQEAGRRVPGGGMRPVRVEWVVEPVGRRSHRHAERAGPT